MGLPKLAESHRLRPEWSQDRLEWRDANGVPVESDLKTKNGDEFMKFADNAAVAGPHEVTARIHPISGELSVEGPKCIVAGKRFQEEQGSLGVFLRARMITHRLFF